MAGAGKLTPIVSELGGDLDQAFEEIRVPTYVIDREARIRWLNRRARELFGDLRGHSFLEIVVDGRATAEVAFAKKLLGTVRTTDYELGLRKLDGSVVRAEVHSTMLGNGTHVIGVFGALDIDDRPAEPAPAPGSSALTNRQLEVLRALGRGQSTPQIQEALNISRETVRNHVQAVLRALSVHSRLGAVAEGRRRGLID